MSEEGERGGWRDRTLLPAVEHRDPSTRTLVLGSVSLLAAVLAVMVWPGSAAVPPELAWLLGLPPLFLALHHRGAASGAAVAAAVVVALTIAQVGRTLLPTVGADWGSFGVAAAFFLATAGGAAWATELRDRAWKEVLTQPMADPVTGLPRGSFTRRFLEVEVGAARRGQSLSVVVFELDRSVELLELASRRELEHLLADVGGLFTKNVRAMNVVGRVGEARFLAVLPGEASSGASVFADRVLRDVARLDAVAGEQITMSAGVAAFRRDVTGADELLERAERALRRAKELDGNKVVLFGEDAYRVGPIQPHFAPREGADARPVPPPDAT